MTRPATYRFGWIARLVLGAVMALALSLALAGMSPAHAAHKAAKALAVVKVVDGPHHSAEGLPVHHRAAGECQSNGPCLSVALPGEGAVPAAAPHPGRPQTMEIAARLEPLHLLFRPPRLWPAS